jgi:hypothetical protein
MREREREREIYIYIYGKDTRRFIDKISFEKF